MPKFPVSLGNLLTYLNEKRLTSVEVTPGWQKCHVEGDISHGGVRLKDGDDGNLHEDEEYWMLPV